MIWTDRCGMILQEPKLRDDPGFNLLQFSILGFVDELIVPNVYAVSLCLMTRVKKGCRTFVGAKRAGSVPDLQVRTYAK